MDCLQQNPLLTIRYQSLPEEQRSNPSHKTVYIQNGNGLVIKKKKKSIADIHTIFAKCLKVHFLFKKYLILIQIIPKMQMLTLCI